MLYYCYYCCCHCYCCSCRFTFYVCSLKKKRIFVIFVLLYLLVVFNIKDWKTWRRSWVSNSAVRHKNITNVGLETLWYLARNWHFLVFWDEFDFSDFSLIYVVLSCNACSCSWDFVLFCCDLTQSLFTCSLLK